MAGEGGCQDVFCSNGIKKGKGKKNWGWSFRLYSDQGKGLEGF